MRSFTFQLWQNRMKCLAFSSLPSTISRNDYLFRPCRVKWPATNFWYSPYKLCLIQFRICGFGVVPLRRINLPPSLLIIWFSAISAATWLPKDAFFYNLVLTTLLVPSAQAMPVPTTMRARHRFSHLFSNILQAFQCALPPDAVITSEDATIGCTMVWPLEKPCLMELLRCQPLLISTLHL